MRGVLVTSRPGEWSVSARHCREQDAYITDYIEEAFAYRRRSRSLWHKPVG